MNLYVAVLIAGALLIVGLIAYVALRDRRRSSDPAAGSGSSDPLTPARGEHEGLRANRTDNTNSPGGSFGI